MKLDLDMKLAKAVVSSTDDKLADVEFAYSAEVLRPEFTVKDDEISIKNRLERFSFGKPVNKWDVKLTDKLPFDVRLMPQT